jgi:hypothetical protein
MNDHGSIRVRSSGSFDLPLAPDQAFPLFTAEGEGRWVPGWSPEMLGSLPQHRGLVFLTKVDRSQTIWTVLESDPETLSHRYSRVTPGKTAGIVEVKLCPAHNGCRVSVSYDMTALTEAGQQALATYRGSAFDDMLVQWQELIATALESEQFLPA